jgi:hypothetical protein
MEKYIYNINIKKINIKMNELNINMNINMNISINGNNVSMNPDISLSVNDTEITNVSTNSENTIENTIENTNENSIQTSLGENSLEENKSEEDKTIYPIEDFYTNTLQTGFIDNTQFIEDIDKDKLRFISVYLLDTFDKRPSEGILNLYENMYYNKIFSNIYKHPFRNISEYEYTPKKSVETYNLNPNIDECETIKDDDLDEYIKYYEPYKTIEINNIIRYNKLYAYPALISDSEKYNELYKNLLKYRYNNRRVNIASFQYLNNGIYSYIDKFENKTKKVKCNVGKIATSEVSLYNLNPIIVNTLLQENYIFIGCKDMHFSIFNHLCKTIRNKGKKLIYNYVSLCNYGVQKYNNNANIEHKDFDKIIDKLHAYYKISKKDMVFFLRLLIYYPSEQDLFNVIKILNPAYKNNNNEHHHYIVKTLEEIEELYDYLYETDIGNNICKFISHVTQKYNIKRDYSFSVFICFYFQYYEMIILNTIFGILLEEKILEKKVYELFKTKRTTQIAYDCVLLQNGIAIRKSDSSKITKEVMDKINKRIQEYMYHTRISLHEYGSKELPVIPIDNAKFEEYRSRVQSQCMTLEDFNPKAVIPIEKIIGDNIAKLLFELLKNKLYYSESSKKIYLKDDYLIIKEVQQIEEYTMKKIKKEYKYWFETIYIHDKKNELEQQSYFDRNEFVSIWHYFKKITKNIISKYYISKKNNVFNLQDASVYNVDNKIIVEYVKYQPIEALNISLHKLKQLERLFSFAKLRRKYHQEIYDKIIDLLGDTADILDAKIISNLLDSYTGIKKYVAFYIYLWDFILSKYDL